jgi:predicted nucleic acid-binding protein
MIVVDTSVWIAARRQPRVANVLNALLEQDEVVLALPVRFELLIGTATHQRAAFLKSIRGVQQLHPTEASWQPLQPWILSALDAGESFGLVDLLIASMTAEIGALVWSLDKDFERMEKLGFVSRYDPPDMH